MDVGCGSGDLLAEIYRRNPNITLWGLEGSRVGAQLSQDKTPSASVFALDLATDVKEWPTEIRAISVDCLVLSEVLEHLDDPKDTLMKCSRFLTQDGLVVVTVPSGPLTTFDKAIGHRVHFTKSTLTELLSEAGFYEVNVVAAGFPFFNLYKLTVLLRGRKLLDDIAQFNEGRGKLARTVMQLFDLFLRATPLSGRIGWQLIATARPKITLTSGA